jgi:hypothetical protein
MNVPEQVAQLCQALPLDKQVEVLDFCRILSPPSVPPYLDGRAAPRGRGQNHGVFTPYAHQ